MHSFENYFAWDDQHGQALQGSYDAYLVFASILIAIFAGYTFMGFTERVRQFDSRAASRNFWIASGGLVMGIGVWAMHFVGMLAYELPIDVSYDPLTTAASAVPAVVASAVAFMCISTARVDMTRIIVGAFVMGGGIGMMHYTGMAGMRADAMMMYDPTLWMLSVAVAVVLAFIALSTTVWSVRTRLAESSHLPRITGAVLMGFAVAGMHYAGMASMRITPGPYAGSTAALNLDSQTLAGIVIVASLVIMATTIISLVFERRLRQEIAHSSHANQQLKYQERRMSLIMNNVADALITVNEDGDVETFNAAAERIFGYPAAEAIGRDLQVFVSIPGADREKGAIAAYLRTGSSNNPGTTPRELVGRHRDGSRIELELVVSEVRKAGTSVLICALRDITQRKLTTAQLQQAQKMEAVGQLSGGIAHDFNNMLGIILGSLDVARREIADKESTVKKIDMAIKAATKGAELNRRLLIFSRRQSLQAEKVDLKHLLADMAPLIRSTIGESIALELNLAGLACQVTTDVVQLESAVINIVINARDAMPNGGRLTIAVDNRSIDPSSGHMLPGRATDGYACLSIADTGTGMSRETLDRAYEPFFTTKEFGKGSGLGLSMVFGFIQQTGGHITIDSELGRGTTVRLYIPCASSSGPEATAANYPGDEDECPGHGETILVVEDNPDMRAVVVTQLVDLDYRIVEAASAAEALDILKSGLRVDLVFSDVVMPGSLSGLDLRHIIRKTYPELPVLLTSGFVRTAPPMREQYVPASTAEILVKPYRKQDLARALAKALRSNGARFIK